MADMNTPTVDNSSRIRPATGLGGKGSPRPSQGGGLMGEIPQAVSSAVAPLIQQAGQQINSGVNSALGTDGGMKMTVQPIFGGPRPLLSGIADLQAQAAQRQVNFDPNSGPEMPEHMRARYTAQAPSVPMGTTFNGFNYALGGAEPQSMFAKGGSVPAAKQVQAQGRGNDTMLVHMTPREVGGLQALAMANGGSLTINPQTGLPEAGFLSNILPTILGIAGTALFPAAAPWMIGAGVGGIEALRTGDIGKGLMAGLGAFGGANLGAALSSAGAAGAGAGAMPTTVAPGATGAAAAQATQGIQAVAPNLAPDVAGAMGQNYADIIAAGAPKGFEASYLSSLGGTQPATFSNIGAGISGLGSEAGRSAMGSALSNQFGAMSTGEKIASGLGAMNTLGGFEQPQMATVEPYEYDYKGPYKPTKRTVTYPGADRTSTSEFPYFSPSNPIPYARGGDVNMEDGGFVMDARSVSEIGNGSSNAGLERLASLGARPIQGRGDGVSDSIPANIGGSQDARVARDEAYFPPEAVMKAGGATKLYAMMDKAHKARKNAKRGQDTGGLRALMA